MRIKEVITEGPKGSYEGSSIIGINDYHDYYIHLANKTLLYIKDNCSPWLNQTKNGKYVVFRGDQFVYSGNAVALKKVRPNRRPSDTNLESHKVMVNLINKLGLTANRHNSAFVTSNFEEALAYGNYGYVTMPVGEFNYTWNPKISDFFVEIIDGDSRWKKLMYSTNTPLKHLLSSDDELSKIIRSYQGDDGSLLKAIKSGNEIMIKAEAIILIDPNFYQFYVFPLMQGRTPQAKNSKYVNLRDY